jgi:hypothetical protein
MQTLECSVRMFDESALFNPALCSPIPVNIDVYKPMNLQIRKCLL